MVNKDVYRSIIKRFVYADKSLIYLLFAKIPLNRLDWTALLH